MRELLTTVGIGFVSGVLSGAFGIGGGIITTPAIALILGAPALVAVGTPLPVIFPSAVTGAINYFRRGSLDVRAGVTCGLVGSAFAVAGELVTQFVGGTVVLLATAALILYTAVDMILQVLLPPRLGLEASEEREAFAAADAPAVTSSPRPVAWWSYAAIGALTGFYSGFLGLGGGFVLVPILTRWLGFDIKRAIGTSLLAIAILAIPGTITHALLGHVDWGLAAMLAIGVIPGAMLGSKMALGSSDRALRIAFALMLLVVGGWLGLREIGWLR